MDFTLTEDSKETHAPEKDASAYELIFNVDASRPVDVSVNETGNGEFDSVKLSLPLNRNVSTLAEAEQCIELLKHLVNNKLNAG